MDTDAGTLGAAIASQPAWVMAMVVVHLLAVVFAATRTPEGWRVRPEPLAILVSFLAAGVFMGWLYEQSGCSASPIWCSGPRSTSGCLPVVETRPPARSLASTWWCIC